MSLCRRSGKFLIVAMLVIALGGCASLMNSATQQMADSLGSAIINQNDLDTVRDGAPAYLLMMDGLIKGSPENTSLLMSGARLYSAYASAFVDDEQRATRLTERALFYAKTALCLSVTSLCENLDQPFKPFMDSLAGVKEHDLPLVYDYAGVWAGWMQARGGDWGAVAELPKLQALLEHLLSLDDAYDEGGIHLYLGVLHTLLPPMLGGKVELGRRHFEAAITLSEGKNLMVKVLFASRYAKLMFDRQLHDRLLTEVLAASPEVPDRVLTNTLAQHQARTLLEEADDYF